MTHDSEERDEHEETSEDTTSPLEAQEGKGYGADPGEREQVLEEETKED